MSWPLSQDYNEAIQDPRNSFSDADLKTGEAVTNALGIPLPHSGNFADVYEVRTPSGARWAVKCFTREIAGLRERYAEISKYLRQANLPFMVDFQYLEQGIRVRGQWFPVLKMQWVEGFVLNDFVRDNLDKKPILQTLGQIWLRMARRLREAKIAHGDLQHGNVMFVPSGSANALAVKLIDYDGMCVPALAGKSSGEVGHPAYQHPERLRSGAYNREVDRFSLLSIAAALRCLTVGGRSLWERYDTGDNLLFRQADLQAPRESPLFAELRSIGDPQAQRLVNELYRACQGRLDAVPLVTDLVLEEKEKPAGKSTAIKARPAAVPGTNWDFGDEEPGDAILRKRRAAGGIPIWAWGAIGGVAALLLAIGVAVSQGHRKGSAKKETAPLVQNQHDTPVRKEEPKRPQEEAKTPDKPTDAPADPIKPPTPDPVAERPAKLSLPRRIFRMAPDGASLAISNEGEGTWRLVNPRTRAVIREFTGHEGAVTGVAFSADGRRAVTSGEDGMLRLWDLQTGQMIGTRKAYNQPVIALALSADGTKAAHANGGVDAEVWNFENKTGGGYHNPHKVTSVAFAPDVQYFFCGFDNSQKNITGDAMFAWPLAPKLNLRVLHAPTAPVTCIAASPDGNYIALGQSGEAPAVSLWEAPTSKLLWRAPAPARPIHQLTFSADSRFLFSAGATRFQVWHVGPTPRSAVGGADVRQELVTAAFTPDSGGVTFAFCKGDQVVTARTVRLQRPAVADNPKGRIVYLADLREEVRAALSFAKRDGSKLNNMAVPNNLFTHPSDNSAAQVVFNLDKKYSRFKTSVGIRDGANAGQGSATPLTFRVLGDGKELWKSTPIQRCGDIRECAVSVTGVDRLQLQVDCPGTSFCAHAVWGEPRLEEDNPSPTPVKPPANPVVVKPPPPPPRPRRFANKPPVPSERTLDDKRKQLQVMHREDYKGKSKLALATQFLQESRRQADLALAYAMLSEAGDLAAREGELDVAFRAASELAGRFAVDPIDAKCRVLEQTLPAMTTKSKDKYRLLMQKALLVLDRAAIDEEFEYGDRLLEVAKAAAAKADASPTSPLTKLVNQQAKEFRAIREEFDPVKRHADTLETNPDDPNANLALGRYRCFVRGDWEGGLPLLAQGGDKALSELAQKDVEAPGDPGARAALGDAWAEHADKTMGKEQEACRRRAAFWYQDCRDELEKKEQGRVNARLSKLAAQLPELRKPFADLNIGMATITRRTGLPLVRLQPPQHLATRQLYRSPIDIRVIVLLPKNSVRITFLNGGELILRPEGSTAKASFYGPYSNDPDGQGPGPSTSNLNLKPGVANEIRIQMKADGWSVYLNGRTVMGQSGGSRPSSFAPSPVRVWADEGEVGVAALVVKRVR